MIYRTKKELITSNEKKVFTYYPNDSVIFSKVTSGINGDFHNMSLGYPLEINGKIKFQTAEALYQACKFPNHPDIQRLIIEQRSPVKAKSVSKQNSKHVRQDWVEDDVQLIVMRWVVLTKLLQHFEKFSSLLLSTKDLEIVQESLRIDAFWAAVRINKNLPNEYLRGSNLSGIILMELRDCLKSGSESIFRSFLVPAPPKIENFLLCNQPIREIIRS